MITDPLYWWERLVLQCNVIWINMGAMFFVANTSHFMNMEKALDWRNWLVTWWLGAALYSISWVVTYLLWVYGAKMRYFILMIMMIVMMMSRGG